MKILFVIAFMLMAVLITQLFIHWIIVFALAIVNIDAKYNESSKIAILNLAKKDKIWKDVAEMLNLEN